MSKKTSRVKTTKWDKVPVTPYETESLTEFTAKGTPRIHRRKSGKPNMQLIPRKLTSEPKRAIKVNEHGIPRIVEVHNNRKTRNSRGVCPRMEPVQYVPKQVTLTGNINGKKTVVKVKTRGFKKIVHTRAY